MKRQEIETRYTWNAPSVFPDQKAWETEYRSVADSLPAWQKYQGQIAGGPAAAADVLEARDQLVARTMRLYMYASVTYAVDTTDQAAAALNGQAQGLNGQAMAAISFIDPELLAAGQTTLSGWMEQEPRLRVFRHYIDDLFRRQAHVRSAEVEELLGMLADPIGSVSNTASLLTDADLKFPPARSSTGEALPVTQGTYHAILAGSDREARRTAWEGYTDTYLAFKNTLASNLLSYFKTNLVNMRARRHPSTLAATLFESNIPEAVYENLIATFRKHLPTWHRYWALRRRALGVEKLYPYDIWAPLGSDAPSIAYPQAVEMICASLQPMGPDYVAAVRKGCLEERWVDVYPNDGKAAGAFSTGAPGTYPFIVMNYKDTIFDVSTLAHELGHSMHTYHTDRNQPVVYQNYSTFVAEVASNFHQALLRPHLLSTNRDPHFQIAVILEALNNYHRYFFIMPTLSRFELEIQQRLERGEGVSADDMISLMADLFEEGYGGEMTVDRQREGITWATFPHMYMSYYVFQYATGISAANALSKRVLSGGPAGLDAYLSFLKAGNSVYPLEALRMAGVDLTRPEPVEEAFGVLAGYVERLEELLS